MSVRSVSGSGETGIRLAVNYYPFLSSLGQVISKNLCFQHQDEEVK